MAEYTAFAWMMTRLHPNERQVQHSDYILIDRLAVNIEVSPNGSAHAIAVLRNDAEEARDFALVAWMKQDHELGLRLDGGVTIAQVEADLDVLAKAHDYWIEPSQDLLAIVRQVMATGVPL